MVAQSVPMYNREQGGATRGNAEKITNGMPNEYIAGQGGVEEL